MAVQTPEQLFMHELGDIYSAERMILQMLPVMAQESNDQQVSQAFQTHEQQTRQQVQNLEQCFQILGQNPPQVICYAVAGIKQEHDTFLKDSPSQNVLTMFDLEGADKVEHYEIVSYKALIEQASLLGKTQCIPLLQQNLQQEEWMANTVERIEHQLAPQMTQRGVQGWQTTPGQGVQGMQGQPGH
ncbi:MAG TPA: ferritin-like domain-containing protein [Ktedonobacteraceae bacterium]|nr:ferritin-like domain-containing protein [Ktedonobacteraceae bacterium]